MNNINLFVRQYLWEKAGEARSLEHARVLRKAALVLQLYPEEETNNESKSDDS